MRIRKALLVRQIPQASWSSPKPQNLWPRADTLLLLSFGLFLFGLGESLLVAAGIGVSPWTVLAQGIANHAHWSVGFATFIISVVVLLVWIPLKQVMGIGTLLNAIIIAATLHYVVPILPTDYSLFGAVSMTFLGIAITGMGSGIYLIANLGPGPRDGLMTGLQKISGWPIAWVRLMIEVGAVSVGWLLGGTVGLGTVLFAIGIGPAVAMGLKITSVGSR